MTTDRLLLPAGVMAEIDRQSQTRYAIPGEILMENAGRSVFAALAEAGPGALVCVAGGGNNGGDALVVARWARISGWDDVTVLRAAQPREGLPELQWRMLRELGVAVVDWDASAASPARRALDRAVIIVDGLAGSGLSGELRQPARDVAAAINAAPGRTVSIDVPSGLHDESDPAAAGVIADLTVVTGFPRPAMYDPLLRSRSGEIRRVEPGFPPQLVRELAGNRPAVLMPDSQTHPAPIRPDAHKVVRGRVLVVGGGPRTAGAPVLSALAARASGCGMVSLLAPAESCAAALAADPSIMALPSGPEPVPDPSLLEWADAVVLGPGWTGVTDTLLAAWISQSRRAGCALLLDASALGALAASSSATSLRELRATPPASGARRVRGAPVVLSPHPGEWRRIAPALGVEQEGISRGLCESKPPAGEYWIVRGSTTWIASSDSGPLVLDGRVPALAHAGTGDVFVGLAGGSLARLAAGAGEAEPDSEDWRTALCWAVQRHRDAGAAAGIDGRPASGRTLVEALMEMPL